MLLKTFRTKSTLLLTQCTSAVVNVSFDKSFLNWAIPPGSLASTIPLAGPYNPSPKYHFSTHLVETPSGPWSIGGMASRNTVFVGEPANGSFTKRRLVLWYPPVLINLKVAGEISKLKKMLLVVRKSQTIKMFLVVS